MTTQSDALRRVERWVEYDRERSVRDLAGRQNTFDSHGDVSAIREAGGAAAEFRYDEQHRLIETVRDGVHTRYAYDDCDRLSEIVSPDSPRRFEYDAQGRIRVVYRGTAGGVVYRYDSSGRVTEFRTAEVSTEQEFCDDGRIRCVRQTINGVVLEAQFAFDAAGRLSELRLPGAQLTYDWDDRGRPLSVAAEGQVLANFEYVDAYRIARLYSANGVVEESVADPVDGRPLSREWRRSGTVLARKQYSYDDTSRLVADGRKDYEYDSSGRIAAVRETGSARMWKYDYDLDDNLISPAAPPDDRVYRIDDAGQLLEVRVHGDTAGRFTYDAKGRLVLVRTPHCTERYLYGPADELMAVTDEEGRPVKTLVHTPLGCVAEKRAGGIAFTHADERGTRLFTTGEDGSLLERFEYDAFGLPHQALTDSCFTGRFWFPSVRLYYFGARWYDPAAGRFLTPDSETAAPDDDRIVGPLYPGSAQRMLRRHLIPKWLGRPRLRNRYAFCGNDPVNSVDPNGHWSFGRVLLMLLGAIWTLPNTIFGLLVEITCLIGEVIRWLVFLFSAGNVSWATPGFDAAASGRLNAFALVFRGGWLGSFKKLLGITFGNVFFVYTDWESDPSIAVGGTVSPPGHGGSVTLPLKDALYEHELRHTVQYSWFGPFFHLGLPIFGVYEWDVIAHGYEDAWLERDARAFGGF